jgi:hypothetical protein
VAWPNLGPMVGLRLSSGTGMCSALSSDGGDNSAQRSSMEEAVSGSSFEEEGCCTEAASTEEKWSQALLDIEAVKLKVVDVGGRGQRRMAEK